MALLSLLAGIANQSSIELLPRVPFQLGSGVVVLALLLLGDRGLLVGVASILLVPRLWSDPAALLVAAAELLWLKLYLDWIGKPAERGDSGWIVLADILFWVLIAIPLNLLLFALISNLDLSSVLSVTLRQGVNGSLNAVIGFALFTLLRLLEIRLHPERSMGVRQISFISLLSLILLSGLFSLSFSLRELNLQFASAQLQRFRQASALTAVHDISQLGAFTLSRRRSGSLIELRLFDAQGRLLYDSNPALFATLEQRYDFPAGDPESRLPLIASLDLIFPSGSSLLPRLPKDSYLRYSSHLDRGPREGPAPLVPQERIVVMVEPAGASIRDLQAQGDVGLHLLGVLLTVGALVSEWLSARLESQFPMAGVPGSCGESPIRLGSPSPLRELRSLLASLREQDGRLESLNDELLRSQRQRRRLEAEVSRLNILDTLTGCYNLRELYRRLDHEISLAVRESRLLSLLCLEIDHLGAIHASYGDSAYQEILQRVALEIRSRCRTTDCLCRLGEHQFALMLTSCDADAASQLAALLTRRISDLEIRHETATIAVTASVGVAVLQPAGDDSESLITRAQRALFLAKAEGRNRVVLV